MCLLKIAVIAMLQLTIVHCGESPQADHTVDTMKSVDTLVQSVRSTLQELVGTIEDIKKSVQLLTKQTMAQQFAMEENLRTAGQSGVHIVRGGANGLNNYDVNSHSGSSANAIHDHANFKTTLGMGEVAVVMNGVYFRTRHNDYVLKQPSLISDSYDATDDIPLPSVPPQVLEKTTVEDQTAEMQQWFLAFKTQNVTLRNYTEYFKTAVCFLEGAWIISNNLEEPFDSERHKLNAISWADLQQKNHFAALSGIQDSRENLAYLPRRIMYINKTTGEPVYGQWNYRMLCKPVERDIPTSLLVHVDDLESRAGTRRTATQASEKKAARFKLYDIKKGNEYQLLDELMYTIPGKDNVPNYQCQQTTFRDGPMYQVNPDKSDQRLNTCFYHRTYRYAKKNAMGLWYYSRGFNDPNLWVAQTHQTHVAPVILETCRTKYIRGNATTICKTHLNRFSYLIPLEIVYLTPLLTWNPYNLTIHAERQIATADGRDGFKKPLNGVDDSKYYLTPYRFYTDGEFEDNSADTSTSPVKVLDQQGVERKTRAAGTYIITRNIPNVGQVRLRYPIAPVHRECSTEWKEINALKDIIARKEKNALPKNVDFEMSKSPSDSNLSEHTHSLTISYDDYLRLLAGKTVKVTTDKVLNHRHKLTIAYNNSKGKKKGFEYRSCDGKPKCQDQHPAKIYIMTKITKRD